ncbi:probable pyridoxal 5'-phosphate synthase subunit PDX2 [Tanacetum coccineum]|uniref:glutaminase n=1 Tax=Tanacetum coccineum TaxID=301880 RepID=A0ABQ4WF97_9ASTR
MAVGVLALQGSFNEHIAALRRIGVKGVEIRKAEQLENVTSLIIPGGESTTMAKLADLHNLFPALREFVKMGKPVWGTCAGLIFLANKATGQKEGGQELIQSFEAEIPVPDLAATEGGPPSFRAVFIRAPAILEVGPDVEVLASISIQSSQEEIAESEGKVIVAVKQGNLLATAFHPELTIDSRWHSYFMKMLPANNEIVSIASSSNLFENQESYLYNKQPKTDLPIYQ